MPLDILLLHMRYARSNLVCDRLSHQDIYTINLGQFMVMYNKFIDNIWFYSGTMKNHKKMFFFVFKESLLALNQLFKEISSVFSLSIRLFK